MTKLNSKTLKRLNEIAVNAGMFNNVETMKTMNEFKQYKRKGLSEMRPYVDGESLAGISVSDPDKFLQTLVGGYIARNPKNHLDQWYVAKKYFDDNLEPADDPDQVEPDRPVIREIGITEEELERRMPDVEELEKAVYVYEDSKSALRRWLIRMLLKSEGETK